MSRYINAEWLKAQVHNVVLANGALHGCVDKLCINEAPSIDIVRCKECKHRPIKEDADGDNYGFNLIEPNDGDDRCPCLVEDGWYSWMPPDNFFCGYGERRE